MIRVNLLGRKGSPKGKGKGKGGGPSFRLPEVPNLGILVFVLMLVIEGAVFYLWQMQATEAADRANTQLQARKRELTELEKNRDEITQLTEEVKKLKEQKSVFDELFAEKVGPSAALQYLSFALQPRDEATTPAEELKAMEAAGWQVAWDARRAWITSYREAAGEVTLQGRAMAHEDVAELARRLESSPYFREPKLVFQENKKDDKLGVTLVEFSIRALLVYQIEPLVKTPPKPDEALPEAASPTALAAGSTAGEDPAAADGPLIAPKLVLAQPVDGEAGSDAAGAQAADTDAADGGATEDDAASTDVADTTDVAAAADAAKPAAPKDKAAAPSKPADNDKAAAPAAQGAAEPPPAAAADQPPAVE